MDRETLGRGRAKQTPTMGTTRPTGAARVGSFCGRDTDLARSMRKKEGQNERHKRISSIARGIGRGRKSASPRAYKPPAPDPRPQGQKGPTANGWCYGLWWTEVPAKKRCGLEDHLSSSSPPPSLSVLSSSFLHSVAASEIVVVARSGGGGGNVPAAVCERPPPFNGFSHGADRPTDEEGGEEGSERERETNGIQTSSALWN